MKKNTEISNDYVKFMRFSIDDIFKLKCFRHSLLAEVSQDEAKIRERRESLSPFSHFSS